MFIHVRFEHILVSLTSFMATRNLLRTSVQCFCPDSEVLLEFMMFCPIVLHCLCVMYDECRMPDVLRLNLL
jgi:hypothetical protein